MASIGERIKLLREKQGLGITDLAQAVGESKQTIYKYENGIVTNIPLPKIDLLAQVLHCSPSYLCGWEDEELTEDKLNYERYKHWQEDKENFGDKLSDDELSLIKLFRLVPEGKRKRVLSAIRLLLSTEE